MTTDSVRTPRSSPSPLSKPLRLACGLVLSNRVVKPAMTESLADDFGRPTPQLCALYRRWASDGGGAAALITGNVMVDRRYVERPGNVCIDGPQSAESIALLRKLVDGVRPSGTKILVQLNHAGRQSNGMINLSPVGPGTVPLSMPVKGAFGLPRPLSASEVGDVVRRFAEAAAVCARAGFDGVQIHAAHGYLLSSFLNPLANDRGRDDVFGPDDPYGGPTLENRARALLEVVRAVKGATRDRDSSGDDVGGRRPFAVSVKLNSADFQQGGLKVEEAATVASWLEEEGIDFLELSGGNYETSIYREAVAQSQPEGQEEDVASTTDKKKKESTLKREAYFLDCAIRVKRALKGTMPLMVTGGWRTRSAMESALERGDCALFGIGRPMCGSPSCIHQLLAADGEYEIPRYEDTMQVGCWWLRWVFRLPLKFFALLHMMSLQSWYYRNLVSIGETGEAGGMGFVGGPFTCLIANTRHEIAKAKALKGEVDCVGNVYKGEGKTKARKKIL